MQPLDGIRVLDFTHIVAGPVASRMLVDLGADVLKLESRRRPDQDWCPARAEELDRAQSFLMLHRGKRSIAIDLKTPDGADLARRLADISDVVVENFSATVMSRLGLDDETLRARNPRLVYVSMSGYGHDGPRRDWKSMNVILQAHSGLMMATGNESEPPISISNSWMDYMGGLHGAFVVLEALQQRLATGKGSHVDLSQFECSVTMLGAHVLAGLVDGVTPPRLGNRSSWAVPQGCYPCAGEDAWCVVSVEMEEQWQALCRVCNWLDWLSDPRFADLARRIEHQDILDSAIEEWTRLRSAEDVARTLQSAGVPAEQVRDARDVYRAATGTVYHVRPFGQSSLLFSVPPFEFVPQQPPKFEPLAKIGEDTTESLQAMLGMDAGEVSALERSEVLV